MTPFFTRLGSINLIKLDVKRVIFSNDLMI
jgi:hypothetical protein